MRPAERHSARSMLAHALARRRTCSCPLVAFRLKPRFCKRVLDYGPTASSTYGQTQRIHIETSIESAPANWIQRPTTERSSTSVGDKTKPFAELSCTDMSSCCILRQSKSHSLPRKRAPEPFRHDFSGLGSNFACRRDYFALRLPNFLRTTENDTLFLLIPSLGMAPGGRTPFNSS